MLDINFIIRWTSKNFCGICLCFMKGVQHMKTIEDLYLGKISPCENMIRGNDNYKDLLRLYSSNQEKLLSTLTEEQKERYEKIG